jgi:hypothetical protein
MTATKKGTMKATSWDRPEMSHWPASIAVELHYSRQMANGKSAAALVPDYFPPFFFFGLLEDTGRV